MEEVKIHTGTRVKLKRVDESLLPQKFLAELRDFVHADDRVLAVFMFALETEDSDEQNCMALAVKSGLFSARNEDFLEIVQEIQLLLPEDMGVNLYRYGSSEMLAQYCATKVEPVYLRSTDWLEKQRRKFNR